MRFFLAVWWWLHPDYMAVTQVVLGLLGLLAAIGAIVYAWSIAQRQFKIMSDQGEVVDRQLELTGRQVLLLEEHKGLLSRIEEIENEQRIVLNRQMEIIGRQVAITEAQEVDRRAAATVAEVVFEPSEWLAIRNTGTVSLDNFEWHVHVPKRHSWLEVRYFPGRTPVNRSEGTLPWQMFHSHFVGMPIQPGDSIPFCSLARGAEPPADLLPDEVVGLSGFLKLAHRDAAINFLVDVPVAELEGLLARWPRFDLPWNTRTQEQQRSSDSGDVTPDEQRVEQRQLD